MTNWSSAIPVAAMLGGAHNLSALSAAQAASALAWWRDAGVDVLVAETPRPWIGARGEEAPAPAVIPEPAPTALPATLPEFQRWLAEAERLPDGSERGRRLSPEGDPAAGLMVLIDAPEPEDATTGQLLSGPAGALFERMMAAIGRDRATLYLASLCLARPLGVRLDEKARDELAALARHHVALAAPKRLLVMGDAASRALFGTEMLAARGRLHPVNHSGVMVEGVATMSPRVLLKRPAQKAEAWKDLRLLMRGMES